MRLRKSWEDPDNCSRYPRYYSAQSWKKMSVKIITLQVWHNESSNRGRDCRGRGGWSQNDAEIEWRPLRGTEW